MSENSIAGQVRRATLDDLPALQRLWVAMHFSPIDLEKQLTSFQVAVTPDGTVVGAVALEISGRNGHIHSESFADFSEADAWRSLFWKRFEMLALNHGLARLWTRETSPFWRQCGMKPAEEQHLASLPAQWAMPGGPWLLRELLDEAVIEAALQTEMAKFKTESLQSAQSTLRSARMIKQVFTWLAVLLAVSVFILSLYMLANHALLPHP